MIRAVHIAPWVALSLLAACLTRPAEETVWVPEDFMVDLRQYRLDADQVPLAAKQFVVWADGLAVYRESSGTTAIGEWIAPLYTTICIYQLQPESVRMYGRLLQRAGLFDIEAVDPEGRELADRDLVLRWRAFGDDGDLGSWGEDPIVFERMLHVANAFVPEGCEFGSPGGETEPRHVTRVPSPVDSLDGAILAHSELLALRPGDPDFERDLQALESVRTGASARRATPTPD